MGWSTTFRTKVSSQATLWHRHKVKFSRKTRLWELRNQFVQGNVIQRWPFGLSLCLFFGQWMVHLRSEMKQFILLVPTPERSPACCCWHGTRTWAVGAGSHVGEWTALMYLRSRKWSKQYHSRILLACQQKPRVSQTAGINGNWAHL